MMEMVEKSGPFIAAHGCDHPNSESPTPGTAEPAMQKWFSYCNISYYIIMQHTAGYGNSTAKTADADATDGDECVCAD